VGTPFDPETGSKTKSSSRSKQFTDWIHVVNKKSAFSSLAPGDFNSSESLVNLLVFVANDCLAAAKS